MAKPMFAVKGYDEYLGFAYDVPECPAGGVLMSGDVLRVLFKSRGSAQSAVTRTKVYARKHDLPWGPFRIVRMREEERVTR